VTFLIINNVHGLTSMFRVMCGIHVTLLGVELHLLVGGTLRIRVMEGCREVLISLVVVHVRLLMMSGVCRRLGWIKGQGWTHEENRWRVLRGQTLVGTC
jgi:hypothetical protein